MLTFFVFIFSVFVPYKVSDTSPFHLRVSIMADTCRMTKMVKYQYELAEEAFDPTLEQMGTVVARSDDEAITLCHAIAARFNVLLECVYEVNKRIPRTVYDSASS